MLDPRPDRGRRWTAVLLATIGAAAAAGVGALLLVTARPAPSEPAPGPAVPSTVGTLPPSAAVPAPAVTETVPAPVIPTAGSPSIAPVASAGAALVSTLMPGDPGFGWPATAFGSAVDRPQPAG